MELTPNITQSVCLDLEKICIYKVFMKICIYKVFMKICILLKFGIIQFVLQLTSNAGYHCLNIKIQCIIYWTYQTVTCVFLKQCTCESHCELQKIVVVLLTRVCYLKRPSSLCNFLPASINGVYEFGSIVAVAQVT